MSFRRRKGRGQISHGSNPQKASSTPEKLPYGLLPWSFTFDFTSAPDPINSGGEGDDWLYEWFDGTGYYGPIASQASYNQTVDGKTGVAKWTKIDDANWNYPAFTAYRPGYPPPYDNKLGRINSWPNNLSDYSTFRMSAEIYYTGVEGSATEWSTRPSFGLGSGFLRSGNTEGTNVPQDITENQWVTFDTGIQNISDYPEVHQVNITIKFNDGDSTTWLDNGGFIAINNLTLTLTP